MQSTLQLLQKLQIMPVARRSLFQLISLLNGKY